MKIRKKAMLATVGTGIMTIATPISAQTTATDAQVTAIEAQVKLLEAKADLAQAKVDQVNVFLDQLPEFDGKVTPDAGTGKFESTVLAATALGFVTDQISKSIGQNNVLILTNSEQFQFGMPFALNSEMRILKNALPNSVSCVADCPEGGPRALLGPATMAAAISTLAGLFRSDVTLTTIGADAIDAPMLANALAAKLNSKDDTEAHVLNGSPGTKLSIANANGFDDPGKWQNAHDLDSKYVWLVLARAAAKSVIGDLSATPAMLKKNKAKIDALNAWIKEFDSFNAKVSVPSKDGPSPLVSAIQASELEDNLEAIVKVDINMAGGSLKNSKSIGTFFGVDPLRVTGGLIASYTIFDVEGTGRARPSAWGMWACSSDQMRLGSVRLAKFSSGTEVSKRNPNLCWQVQAFPRPQPGAQTEADPD